MVKYPFLSSGFIFKILEVWYVSVVVALLICLLNSILLFLRFYIMYPYVYELKRITIVRYFRLKSLNNIVYFIRYRRIWSRYETTVWKSWPMGFDNLKIRTTVWAGQCSGVLFRWTILSRGRCLFFFTGVLSFVPKHFRMK